MLATLVKIISFFLHGPMVVGPNDSFFVHFLTAFSHHDSKTKTFCNNLSEKAEGFSYFLKKIETFSSYSVTYIRQLRLSNNKLGKHLSD